MNKALVINEAVTLNPFAIADRISDNVRLPRGAYMTPVGIIDLPERMPARRLYGLTMRVLREYYGAGYKMQACLFALGDLMNAGLDQWGDMYDDLMSATGYAYSTLSDAKYVCKYVPFSLRRENLSWTHHKAVAPLSHFEQAELLAMADERGLSVRDLQRIIEDRQAARDGKDPNDERVRGVMERAARSLTMAEVDRWPGLVRHLLWHAGDDMQMDAYLDFLAGVIAACGEIIEEMRRT